MSKYMDTKTAAASVSMKPGDLTAFVKRYGIEVERVGRIYLWDHATMKRIIDLYCAIDAGKCVHCSKPWDQPDAEEE